MKEIVWEIQNDIFRRPSSSWVFDQINILHILINNSRSMWPTKIFSFSAIFEFLRQFASYGA